MRLHDSYLRSIAYIGTARPDEENGIDTRGTGFLLNHEGHNYLVTAAHVAVDFVDGPMAIRLNKAATGLGGIEHIETTNWFFHPDDKIDVAVMPISVPIWARAEPLLSRWIATEFKVQSKDFGAGDLAYVVGIFNKMRGKDKNEPFVHTGHIASMGYGETAIVEDWRSGQIGDIEVSGYFVQATTLPESSGSPVFVRRTLFSPTVERTSVRLSDGREGHAPVKAWKYGTIWLLGVWSGNWESPHDSGVIVGDDMGLCIPAPRILEVLDRKELKAMRQKAREKEAQRTKLGPQKAKRSKVSLSREAENPNHRED